MPVVRFNDNEEEALKAATPQVKMIEALKTNRAIGDFIVGELSKKYGDTDLGGKLINPQAISVTVKWG